MARRFDGLASPAGCLADLRLLACGGVLGEEADHFVHWHRAV